MLNSIPYDIYSVLDLDTPLSSTTYDTSHLTQRHDDFDRYLNMRQEAKEKFEDLPNTIDSQTNEFQAEAEDLELEMKAQSKNDLYTQKTPVKLAPQPTRGQIQFSKNRIAHRKQILSGYDYETQNLGKHLQTSTSSFLSLLTKTRELDQDEQPVAKEFITTNGGIEDFKRLFELNGLGSKCREYYESSSFLYSILKSAKMDLKSKMAMLRHLEKFRKMTFKEPQKWK